MICQIPSDLKITSLQKFLNDLESYCDKWEVKITQKTKVVLFNRQGSLITKHKFHYKQWGYN